MSVGCSYPFLPQRLWPHVTGNTFGTREYPCEATSTGRVLSGLQSFDNLQAPTLARPPDRSHRSLTTGRPGRLHHASPGWLPRPGCGIATCPKRATDRAGLSPAGWQPCRLLLPALRAPAHFATRFMRLIRSEPLSPSATSPLPTEASAQCQDRSAFLLPYSPDLRSCRLLDAFIIRPCLTVVDQDFTCSKVPSLHGRYPASPLLRT